MNNKFLLLALLMNGCVPMMVPVAPESMHMNKKSDYKLLSECLFSSLAVDREDIDFSLFTCTRSAVLSKSDDSSTNFVKITSVSEGSLVDVSADTKSIDQIARYLERCENELMRNYIDIDSNIDLSNY